VKGEKMKSIVVVLALFILSVTAGPALAHPPSDIIITYDPVSKTLQAVIKHQVSNPQRHFIKKVDVSLNGKEILIQHLTKQDSNDGQTVHYVISDVKDSDILAVEAYCSITGKLKKEKKASQAREKK